MGYVENIKYLEHDVWDLAKFPIFEKKKYMENKPQLGGIVLHEEKEWIQGENKSRILRFLGIPHFGRSPEVNACVKNRLTLCMGRICG